MKETILKAIRFSLKNVKADYFRYLVMKPLFKLNNQVLQGFKSYRNDQYFIYNVQGVHLPANVLHWFSSYQAFEDWCDRMALNKYAIKPGDVVVDIGAGIGEEIIVLSKRAGDSGKVYAIEANTGVFEILQEVKDLNQLRNTEIFNLAISMTNEEVELEVVEGGSIGGTIGGVTPVNANADVQMCKVQGSRMDTFLKQQHIETIDLLKCNIEGAERFVVDSISKEQLRKVKHVAIACHDFRYLTDGNLFFKTKQHVADFLVENGFEISFQNTGISYIDDYVYGVNRHQLT